jgi:hypothetical protein
MGGPEMAAQFTWGLDMAPKPPALVTPGEPGALLGSACRRVTAPGPRPAEWNAVISEHTPSLSERPVGAVALLCFTQGWVL